MNTRALREGLGFRVSKLLRYRCFQKTVPRAGGARGRLGGEVAGADEDRAWEEILYKGKSLIRGNPL